MFKFLKNLLTPKKHQFKIRILENDITVIQYEVLLALLHFAEKGKTDATTIAFLMEDKYPDIEIYDALTSLLKINFVSVEVCTAVVTNRPIAKKYWGLNEFVLFFLKDHVK